MNVAESVRRLIRRFAAAGWGERELRDDLPLGKEGIGMDSLRAIDLLFACEKEFGVEFDEDFLNRGGFTVGEMVACVEEGMRRKNVG